MRKVKIVFFADVLKENFDGVSITLHQILKRLPAERFEATIVTPHPPTDTSFAFPVVHCPYVRFPLHKDYRLALPGRMKDLENLLDTIGPDIVHWTSPSFLGSYAIRYGLKRNIPVTAIYHTHFPSYLGYYLRRMPFKQMIVKLVLRIFYRMYRNTSLIFAPTRGMADFLAAHGIPRDQVEVWGRGVDTTRFHPGRRDEHFMDRLGVAGKKRVLFVARLVKEKETDTLVRLYEKMTRSREDLRLIVTGDGPEMKALKAKMPGAVFTGQLVGKELATIYASSDVFVFPSVTETFGNVVLEAMASGLPVVAANAGGPADIIRDGVTGLLTVPRSEDDLFEKISSVLDRPGLAEQLRTHALEYAKSQRWEALCEALFSMYHTLAFKN